MTYWPAKPTGGAVLLGLLGSLSSCGPTDYFLLPAYSAERHLLQVVVEVPAGTNQLRRFDARSKTFEPVRWAGQPAVVAYLPCPGNQGFVPGTGASPLAALVLAESQPPGTVQEVLPLGLLTLDVAGQLQRILLATPARPSQQLLPTVTTWQELQNQYPSVKAAISQWYQHQGRPGEVRLVGWKNEQAALQAVQTP